MNTARGRWTCDASGIRIRHTKVSASSGIVALGSIVTTPAPAGALKAEHGHFQGPTRPRGYLIRVGEPGGDYQGNRTRRPTERGGFPRRSRLCCIEPREPIRLQLDEDCQARLRTGPRLTSTAGLALLEAGLFDEVLLPEQMAGLAQARPALHLLGGVAHTLPLLWG